MKWFKLVGWVLYEILMGTLIVLCWVLAFSMLASLVSGCGHSGFFVSGDTPAESQVRVVWREILDGQNTHISEPSVTIYPEQCPEEVMVAVGCTRLLDTPQGFAYEVWAPQCTTLVHELMHVYLFERYGGSSSKHDEPEWKWVFYHRKKLCEDLGLGDFR